MNICIKQNKNNKIKNRNKAKYKFKLESCKTILAILSQPRFLIFIFCEYSIIYSNVIIYGNQFYTVKVKVYLTLLISQKIMYKTKKAIKLNTNKNITPATSCLFLFCNI